MLTQRFAQSSTKIRKMSTYIPKNRLEGKVAIVTASTDGIGYAIAKRFAQEGAKVVISSRKQDNVNCALEELKNQKLDVAGVVCHVGKADHRKKLMETACEKFGGIDILISNAGVNPSIGGVLDCEEKAWDKIFEINVKSSYLIAKEVLPFLRHRGGGSIVFISSIGGFQPLDNLGAYSVSKTALLGLTKAAALQLGAECINVNCIAPGIIETKFSKALTEEKTAKQAIINQVPMKRLGQVDDIAGVAAFLVSDDAKYITGETIIAAGGMASRL